MNNSLWDKRIPTLLGIFLITIGIAVTSYMVQIGAIPFLKAAPSENPKNIRITNINDSSFTVTYTTDASVLGTLDVSVDSSSLSTNNPNLTGQVVLDDRDQPKGIPAPYTVHSLTVRDLKPKTQYFFSISSGKTTFLNGTSPFSTTTGDIISASPSAQEPITGSLLLPDGTPAQDALVYVTTDGGQTLSTLVKPDGIYIIPLNTMRTTDLSSFLTFSPDKSVQLLALTNTLESKATLISTQQNPVPQITLPNDYDFTVQTTPLATTSALPIGFPIFSLDTTIHAEPIIETPTKDQTFSDSQPILRGKAIPNANVEISIHSQQTISANVTADSYGNWIYRPSSPLAPGQHTISIVTKDQFGILKTIEQTFTIFQSGTQVVEAATPSGGPIVKPTATPTPKPTAIPTKSPSHPSPTVIVVTPTSSPILNTSPTQIIRPTLIPTQKPLPPTGSNDAVTVGIAGIATTALGALLFLVTRGASL